MIDSGPDIRIICRYNDVFLTVRVLGSGEKKIIAFHGYGQDGNVFQQLLNNHDDITIYSFDLFYHGLSDSPITSPGLSHELLGKLFNDFCRQTGLERYSLLGFSMGAKYALSILTSFSLKAEKLILIAPDGIKKDFWYMLATRFFIFRKLFYLIVNKPAIFYKMAMFLDRLKLVDGRVRKFAVNEMNSHEKRLRVYKSWLYLKKLFVQKKKLIRLINKYDVSTLFILGSYDRIIPSNPIEKFSSKLKNSKVVHLKSGHTHLLDRFFEKSNELLN